MLNRAVVETEWGGFDKAIEDLEKALIYNEKWYGEQHPKTAVAYENFAFALLIKMEHDEARKNFEKAKEIFMSLGMEEDVIREEDYLDRIDQLQEEDEAGGYWELETIN